jgi:phage baseplate assembly protein V
MVNRAVVTLVHDAHKMQELQLRVLAGETLDGIERFQNFGHTSRPLAGAEAVVLAAGGQRAHTIAVVVDDRRYRPTDLAEGESQVYNAFGEYVYLKEDGTLAINARSKVHVTAPEVVADCDTAKVNATDSVTVDTATATVKASTAAKVESPKMTVTGQLVVQGTLLAQGGMAVSGGGGGPAGTVEGGFQVTDGDVEADGTSLKHHKHTGDSGGTTSEPQ